MCSSDLNTNTIQASAGTCAYISDCSGTGGSRVAGIIQYYGSSVQGPTADQHVTLGIVGDQQTNNCTSRNWHCSGTGSSESYDDTLLLSCGIHKYVDVCTSVTQSCGNYFTINNFNGEIYVGLNNISEIYQSGYQNVNLSDNGIKVANFSVNFSQNYSWSDVIALSDPVNGKALIHVPAGHPEIPTTKTLYVPVVKDTGNITICPNATTLNEITRNCPNKVLQTGLTSVNGYYEVQVTGTGVMETPSYVEVSEVILNETRSGDLTCYAKSTNYSGNITYFGDWYKNGEIFVSEIWNETSDTGGYDYSKGLVIDASGNSYVGGFSSPYSPLNWDYQIYKLNSSGNLIFDT